VGTGGENCSDLFLYLGIDNLTKKQNGEEYSD